LCREIKENQNGMSLQTSRFSDARDASMGPSSIVSGDYTARLGIFSKAERILPEGSSESANDVYPPGICLDRFTIDGVFGMAIPIELVGKVFPLKRHGNLHGKLLKRALVFEKDEEPGAIVTCRARGNFAGRESGVDLSNYFLRFGIFELTNLVSAVVSSGVDCLHFHCASLRHKVEQKVVSELQQHSIA
jgi:hypothetical protein